MQLNSPSLSTPDDFLEFWDATASELETVSPEVESEPFHHHQHSGLTGTRLSFRSLQGARIRGYALGWDDSRPRPLVMHAHGYGGRSVIQWLWARSGVNVVGFDVRGFGESYAAVPARSPWGYMLTGIESPQEHVLRGAVCDYMRASEVGASLFEGRVQRTVFHGYSFSGALALMSEAISRTASLLVAGVPTFGWHEGRHRLVQGGSAAETRRFVEAHPNRRAEVMRTLSYFDSMNFAPLIKCPTFAAFGRKDSVVPAETVQAILAHLRCPRETMSLPVSHTDEPAEAAWEYFDATWLDLALHGIPQDFGSEPSPVHVNFPPNS